MTLIYSMFFSFGNVWLQCGGWFTADIEGVGLDSRLICVGTTGLNLQGFPVGLNESRTNQAKISTASVGTKEPRI